MQKGMTREIENDVEAVDPMELKLLKDTVDGFADKWRAGTMDILETRNPQLLQELKRHESSIDSLLLLSRKPKQLIKQLHDELAAYKKTAEMCMLYADRHLPPKK